MRQAWREARENNPKPQPVPRRRFDTSSWSGALLLMAGFTAVLWIVQAVNAADDYRLDRFGMRPRQVDGLWGIVTQPFLSGGYDQLLSNTLPVLLVGWALMLSGPRVWAVVTAVVVVVGGTATWLVAPPGLISGASSLVFGWLGYLIARAAFSRRLRWIVTAVVVLLFFGTLLGQLVPSLHSRSQWQTHLCGFLAGVLLGAVLHPRRRPPARRAASAPPVS